MAFEIEYEVPSFQWMLDTSRLDKYSLNKGEPSNIIPVDDSIEIVADGTLSSYLHAVKPLEIGGSYEPPFEQSRWAQCCENAINVSKMRGVILKPLPEVARILYLDLDEPIVDESEIDDWMPIDTSDGYDPETSDWDPTYLDREADAKAYGHLLPSYQEKEIAVSDIETDRQNQDVKNVLLKPDPLPARELTLGDRFMPIEEEFGDTGADYDVTLNLINPVESRIARVKDTLGGLESGVTLTSPLFLERVSLNRVDAVGHHMLPTHAYFDDTYYQALEENADYSSDFNKLKIKQSDVDWYRDPDKYYEPKLTIGSFQKRIGTQKTVLTALKKRNADVPEMSDAIDVKRVAREVADKFISSYLNVDGKDCFINSLNVMAKGLDYHKKWKDHRELSGVTIAAGENLQRYQHMIKTDIKPVVTDTLHLDRAIAATITFHGKGVTSCFSPFFTACFENFSMALKSRFIVPIGKISSLEIPNVSLNNKWFLEADLSKFDKSQGELHLEFQREILHAIGFPVHLSNWWADFHRESYLNDPHAKVSLPVSFQRRTGDAFTYFGNTIVTMAMMAYTFDMDLPELAIFSGDDSLLVLNDKPNIDTDIFQRLFNMEVKIMEPSVPYVCSKFLLETELGSVVSVPDPLREIQRMSKRKILKDPEVLRAHFTSFKDRMRFLDVLDDRMISILCRYVSLKYLKPSLEQDVREALACFSYYSESFFRFAELYAQDGKFVYQVKDPISHFKGDEILGSREKDGDYFHNWHNPVFPRILDKAVRVFGKYSTDYNSENYKKKSLKCEEGKLIRKSLSLAYDHRDLLKSKLKRDRLLNINDLSSSSK
uniref:RNA-directed RNA polymerase 2a n=1 Tax=Melandrium yellow fleck virus TaxID=545259 RepID=A0A7D6A089_9BROM|nr:2a protein [Melandrium yellow fleck virus]